MMNGLLYMMRHGETAIERDIPVHEWSLTKKGVDQAEALAMTGLFDSIDVIFSSPENKALQTARPFVERLGVDVVIYSELRELDREKGGLLSDVEYTQSVEGVLNNHKIVPGWELRADAMTRFQLGLAKIMSRSDFKEALLISHGLVLSMHFAFLLGAEDVFSRWQRLKFCAWGTIKDNKVIKDIV